MATPPHDPSTPDPELEQLLRGARPAPSVAWSAALERTLVPRAQRSRRRAFGLAGAVCGLAAVVGVVSLAGGGPLAPGGGDAAKAKPGCHVVYVVKVAPVGEVVRRSDGTVEVETSTKPVPHAVQRCR